MLQAGNGEGLGQRECQSRRRQHGKSAAAKRTTSRSCVSHCKGNSGEPPQAFQASAGQDLGAPLVVPQLNFGLPAHHGSVDAGGGAGTAGPPMEPSSLNTLLAGA